MKKTILLSLLAVFLVPGVTGQTPVLDSLLRSLKSAGSDTSRIMLYYRISHEYQFNNMEESLKFAEKALQESERTGFRKGKAYSLIQLGNIEQIRSNYTRAEELNFEALEILKKIDDKTGEAICYNNLGIIYHDRSDYRPALHYYNLSLAANRELNRKTGEAISLFCIGTVYENMVKYDSALMYYFKGQEISEKTGDRKLQAYAAVSLANVYFAMKNFEKATEYNLQAAALYETSSNTLGQIKVFNSLGQISVIQGRLDEATSYYRNSLQASKVIQSNSDVAFSLFSIGQIFEQRDMPDSAFYHYRQAWFSYAADGNAENTAQALIAMARVENNRNRYNEAANYLIRAYNMGDSLQSPKVLMEVYQEIANTFFGLEDHRSAFLYYRKFSEMKDSIMTLEKQNQILDLQTRYETDKKEKENILLKQEQQILRITRNFLIAGALMMVLIAFLILRNLRLKKRDNALLRLQKEEIRQQKEIVEEQKKEITDSIRYARRIQTAMLPSAEAVSTAAPESFILYLPRDIVSGDFYVLRNLDEETFLVCAADCTGHGVPGAFMSMLGISLLNDIITNHSPEIANATFPPSMILENMRSRIKAAMGQTGKEGEAKDGMDMSLCIVNRKKGILRYAGANNPVYIVFNEVLTEIKATRNPIGIYISEKAFETAEMEVRKNSMLYLFSDGYSDQPGSEGSKFLSKNLKKLCSEIANLPVEEQYRVFLKTHLDWRGKEEQIDDVLLLGVRI